MHQPPSDDTYAEGLKALRNVPFLQGTKWREQQDRANRKGANIDILDFERALVKRMAKLGVPMFCHCLRRTEAEQNALYVQGHSKAKGRQSPHYYACAVDIVHSVKAWNLTRKEWALIGHIGKEVAQSLGVKITWGGDWSFYDPAHWELTDWRTLPHAAFGD